MMKQMYNKYAPVHPSNGPAAKKIAMKPADLPVMRQKADPPQKRNSTSLSRQQKPIPVTKDLAESYSFIILLCVLSVTTALFTYYTYVYLDDSQETVFLATSRSAIYFLNDRLAGYDSSAEIVGVTIGEKCPATIVWPLCSLSLSAMNRITKPILDVFRFRGIGVNTLVRSEEIEVYNDYVEYIIKNDLTGYPATTGNITGTFGVYGILPDGSRGPVTSGTYGLSKYENIMLPVLNIAPIDSNWRAINFDIRTEAIRSAAIDKLLDNEQYGTETDVYQKAVITDFIQLIQDIEPRPGSLMIRPVYPAFNESVLVGTVAVVFNWDEVFRGFATGSYTTGLFFEISSATASHLFEVRDDSVVYKGATKNYRDTLSSALYKKDLKVAYLNKNGFQVTVYATASFYDDTVLSPLSGCLIVLCFMLVIVFVLIINNFYVKRDAQYKKLFVSSKRAFVQYISHSIREPLNNISLTLKILENDILMVKHGGGSTTASSGLSSVGTPKVALNVAHRQLQEQQEKSSPRVGIFVPDPSTAKSASDSDRGLLPDTLFRPDDIAGNSSSTTSFHKNETEVIKHNITPLLNPNTINEQAAAAVAVAAPPGPEYEFQSKLSPWLEMLTVINESSYTASLFLSDILDYNLVENHMMVVEKEPVTVCFLLSQVVEMHAKHAMELDLHLTLLFGTEPYHPQLHDSFVVSGDKRKLAQVFRILLTHAIKYSLRSGDIDVMVNYKSPGDVEKLPPCQIAEPNSVSTNTLKPFKKRKNFISSSKAGPIRSGSAIVISFTDYDQGASDAELATFFSDALGNMEGVPARSIGPGYFVAKTIVDLHGGFIAVSSPGLKGGVSVTIELPLVPDERAPLIRTKEQKVHEELSKSFVVSCSGPQGHVSKKGMDWIKRTLIVDDALVNRKMLGKVILNASKLCECVYAEDGQDAVELVKAAKKRKEKFDLILMDLEMPRLDGAAATKVIREMGIMSLIIGITGNVVPEVSELFAVSGADAVLHKPLSLEKLTETVQRLHTMQEELAFA